MKPDRTSIHARIRSQRYKFLVQVLLVFASLGVIAFFGWILGSTQSSVFRVQSHLLDDEDLSLFDESILDTFQTPMQLTKTETVISDQKGRAWAAEWLGSKGFVAKFWAVDSFGLENRNSPISGIPPETRAQALFDSIVESRFATSSTAVTRFNYRMFSVTESYSPSTGTFIALRSGRFVIRVTSPDSLDYVSALTELNRARLLLPPTFPVSRWNRFRLNQDLWAIAFALISSILWMWQITTSGTRAARLPGSSETSDPEVVIAGLRTLIDAHPGIEVSELGDNKWSLVVRGDFEGRHLLSNDSASLRHEFRLRLRDRKAIVVESVKAKTRSSDGKSISRGTENSRIVPMIEIPGGMPPIAPSAEGFRVVLESFEPSDLRYALAYYFQLHGWGWEPRLF
ncbi:MAG: hypothetical protein RL173_2637 [Fibrobacterota bacterium]|jgi:hypothetical protein